jgi:hypothetical protein
MARARAQVSRLGHNSPKTAVLVEGGLWARRTTDHFRQIQLTNVGGRMQGHGPLRTCRITLCLPLFRTRVPDQRPLSLGDEAAGWFVPVHAQEGEFEPPRSLIPQRWMIEKSWY